MNINTDCAIGYIMNVPGTVYYLLHSGNYVRFMKASIQSGVVTMISSISTDPNNALLKQSEVFDQHPSMPNMFFLTNGATNSLAVWDYTTMTGTPTRARRLSSWFSARAQLCALQ